MIGTNLQSPRSARTVGCVSAGQESVVSSSGRSRCHFSSEHVQPHVWVTPFRECKEKERRLCTWVLSSVRMRAPLPLLSALCVPDRSLKAQAPSSPPQSSRVRTPVLARLHCTFHWSITPTLHSTLQGSSSFSLFPEAPLNRGGTLTCCVPTLSLPLLAHFTPPRHVYQRAAQDLVAAATRLVCSRRAPKLTSRVPPRLGGTDDVSEQLSTAARSPGRGSPNSNAVGVGRVE